MTWPLEYQRASLDFEHFMVAARDAASLQTTNMAWNMVEGVLHVFRRRLTAQQVAEFASVLPPVVRALFIEGWNPEEVPVPFGTRGQLLEEVRALRHKHNFSPPNAIECVAQALRESVDEAALDQVLAKLPSEARSYWAPTKKG
jgi:uncharacterized protein (DUF2267 family)